MGADGPGLTRLLMPAASLHPDETPEGMVGKYVPMRSGSHNSETFHVLVLAAEAVEEPVKGVIVTLALDAPLQPLVDCPHGHRLTENCGLCTGCDG